ncbi:MAG: hypothetical protein E6G97_17090 [Alphaproteobacteria bacterium]|nr:MAG: hypothetical protein E6G97_17090 [Alphaproteobacteria bacterium]
MRAQEALSVVLALALIGLGIFVSARGPSRDCPAPTAQSVESLFAPCLEQRSSGDRLALRQG